jgi:DNA sulfur modification protein DndB
MSFSYNFSAVKGKQAGRDYYIAMIPLGLLPKLFNNEDEYLLPEYRAQRKINEQRIPKIRDYILDNPNTYVFSALSASIDGQFTFEKSALDENLGLLHIDMNAVFLINDGQHRKAAIEAALKENPALSNETISVVLFRDEGLKRSQQMFADLNKHAVKPSKSLSTYYDGRDDLSNAVKEVVSSIPFLTKYIDKESDSLGKYSSKLFTLANFLRANQRIIKSGKVFDADSTFLIKYWSLVFECIDEWQEMDSKRISKCSFKEDYVLTLSVVMNAFGRLGHCFYTDKLDLNILKKLNDVDWLRCNTEWNGRVFNEQGRITGKEDSVIKISNLIKIKLGMSLNKDEQVKENELKR